MGRGGAPGEEMGSKGGGGSGRGEPRLFVRLSVWSVATRGGGRDAAPPPPNHLGPGSPGRYKDIVNWQLLTATLLERRQTHRKEQKFKCKRQTKNIHIHSASSAIRDYQCISASTQDRDDVITGPCGPAETDMQILLLCHSCQQKKILSVLNLRVVGV